MTTGTKTRFHISSSGKPEPCTATQRACPLGGEHFDSAQDAAVSLMRQALGAPLGADDSFDDPDEMLAYQQHKRLLAEDYTDDELREALDAANTLGAEADAEVYSDLIKERRAERIASAEAQLDDQKALADAADFLARKDLTERYGPGYPSYELRGVTPEMVADHLKDKSAELGRTITLPELAERDGWNRDPERPYLSGRSPVERMETFLYEVKFAHETKERLERQRREALADADIAAKEAAIKKQNRSFGQLGEERARQKVQAELAELVEQAGGDFAFILRKSERERELHEVARAAYEAMLTYQRQMKYSDGEAHPEYFESAPSYEKGVDWRDVGYGFDSKVDQDKERSYEAQEAAFTETRWALQEADPARSERWKHYGDSASALDYVSDEDFQRAKERALSMVGSPDYLRRLREGHRQGGWKDRIKANFLYGPDGDAK
jgi:hypothetical protein